MRNVHDQESVLGVLFGIMVKNSEQIFGIALVLSLGPSFLALSKLANDMLVTTADDTLLLSLHFLLLIHLHLPLLPFLSQPAS